MSQVESESERRLRRWVVLLVLFVMIVQPVWSRLVNELWDAATAEPTPIASTPPAGQATDPVAATPEIPAAEPAPIPAEETAAPIAEAPEPAAMTEQQATVSEVPAAARLPKVLGASPRGDEIRVLVDLGGATADAAIGEICIQAQAFVDVRLTGALIRVLSQVDELPTEDIGSLRCPGTPAGG